MATLAVDVVVEADESVEQVARLVAGPEAGKVTWTVGKSGNGWPEVIYTGSPEALAAISQRHYR